ncbi:hypothetical protein Lgee_1302 [Legionella geestiana]|uniref:Uncharacterized protein n=1 Tax=Legionella geestiana TaxID=45065 RepID=A0A0W0TU49_9GAMM|nr:hypothetical protein [Legionella geestiana]KTC99036.1 hypothetical protein Lgee_1302 [Legionella geestiana]QBS12632.1 hypothetical protein E4T54_07690 [Legionella geestiana]QDQ39650.1 hypothetical protein E3226_004160 [Legionella geestiana]STX54908.1 Uncharacterised protein [Legionella geestiana]
MHEEDNDNAAKYTSACDVLEEMLQQLPKVRVDIDEPRRSVGVSTDGNISISMQEPVARISLAEDTNALLRAQLACERHMVVSPLSGKRNMIFARPEDIKRHEMLAEERAARREEEQRAQQSQEPEHKRSCSIQ